MKILKRLVLWEFIREGKAQAIYSELDGIINQW